MNSGSGSKRKESSGHRAFTGNGSRKRAKTTAGSTNAHRSAGRDGGNGDSDTAPARPAHALSNLRDTCRNHSDSKREENLANTSLDKQEQQEYQRSIDELNDKLEASEQKVEQYRSKYKHGLSDMVEKKTAAAEQRVSDAEHKIKQIKQKHKEDIIGIRKELVEAAKDGMGQAAQNTTSSPERAYDTAETALKKLKKMDPELYYELVTSQHCYEKIAAKLEEARVTIDRAPTGLQLAQSPDEATSECARALKTLETDLVDAAEDMRSNSTLSNQKKTLVSLTRGKSGVRSHLEACIHHIYALFCTNIPFPNRGRK